ASGTMRLDLAQYREMAALTQFAGDLDESSKSKLSYGRSLMRILRQKQYSPIPRHRQVIMLTAALNHRLQNIPEEKISDYLESVCLTAEKDFAPMCEDIDTLGAYNAEYINTILSIADSTEI
ncbi:MAG: F0F1 ATP synthase subunit alpha, partial [Clostridia bacterium]|nr:F0F1 ATP synthase subunit alpha [Clostridia bacterium]